MVVQPRINRVLGRRVPQGPAQCPEHPVRRRARNPLRLRDKRLEILADADEAWAAGLGAVAPICSK
jgi:hypothetical protein